MTEGQSEDLIELLRSILDFEDRLRALLLESMKKRFGKKWLMQIDQTLEKGLKPVLGQVKAIRERFALEPRAITQEQVVSYLTFGQYIELANDPDIFECLSGKLGPQAAIVEGLSIIATTRNEIAHGRTEFALELAPMCKWYIARFKRHLLYSPAELAELASTLGLDEPATVVHPS